MKPTLLIKQHQKCIKILMLICKVDGRISFWQTKIGKPGYISITGKINNNITEQKAIRSRLINYYAKTFNKMQITEPA